MDSPRPLHRLFGLSWTDFLQNTGVGVEVEMDLSLKQQFVDIVLIRKGTEPIPKQMPDGFDELAPHNLVTFKSHQEALDGWALCELVAHYVNYRKQSSPSMQDLLPEKDYRLFAVCVRYPNKLAQQVELTALREGVFEVRMLTLPIRIIVVHQLPKEEQNAMLHLFSAREDLLRYGKEHYRPRSKETSTLLYELFLTYREDPEMANQLEEFVRASIDELLAKTSPRERLKGLSPEERLEGLSPEERLEGLSPEERLKGLSPEELRAAMEAATRGLVNGSSTRANES